MVATTSKTTDANWKIKLFRQEKKYFTNIIIKFKVLAMKAKTNDIHVIFLLKKNVRTDIIKTILEYLPIAICYKTRMWTDFGLGLGLEQ